MTQYFKFKLGWSDVIEHDQAASFVLVRELDAMVIGRSVIMAYVNSI